MQKVCRNNMKAKKRKKWEKETVLFMNETQYFFYILEFLNAILRINFCNKDEICYSYKCTSARNIWYLNETMQNYELSERDDIANPFSSIVIQYCGTIQHRTKEVKDKITGRIMRRSPLYITRHSPQQRTADNRDCLQKKSFNIEEIV